MTGNQFVSRVQLCGSVGLLLTLTACSSDIESSGRGGASARPRPSATAGAGAAATVPGAPSTVPATAPPVSTTPGADATAAAPSTCAEGYARVTLLSPTVWLVVDGSSSMTEEFSAGTNRWQALRSTLMGPTGVVATLQRAVPFGMVIYSGNDAGNECVQLVTVPPALDNFAALDAAYPQMPIGRGTPTDKALDHVFTQLPVLNSSVPDAMQGTTFVVLATDGAPNDMCGGGGRGGGGVNADVEQRVVDIAARATQMGAQIFVVSLAGGDTRLQSHLETVAGVTASKHPPFVPATQMELVDALRAIVGSGTCQLKLNGRVLPGQECLGTVTLNGAPLPCGAADGWQLTDSSTLQLIGTACDTFLTQESMLQASFPCNVFAPQ